MVSAITQDRRAETTFDKQTDRSHCRARWRCREHGGHLGAVWVDDIEAVVAGEGDPLDAHHLLHVGHAPPAYHRHKDVGKEGQPFQYLRSNTRLPTIIIDTVLSCCSKTKLFSKVVKLAI